MPERSRRRAARKPSGKASGKASGKTPGKTPGKASGEQSVPDPAGDGPDATAAPGATSAPKGAAASDSRRPPAGTTSATMPPPEFDDFLLRIGRMNYAWTNTESLLIHLIAGLVPCDKETATILHLTLNTSRARLDLVDRLCKRAPCPLAEPARERVLAVSGRMKRLSGLRNRLNHSIYAFDAEGGPVRAIEMRIADRKKGLRLGGETALDSTTLAELDAALDDIQEINREIWAILVAFKLPL